ncbi:hypothetical protein LTR62_004425 [Meristemomyces frigidus]|uniref:Uncharacterized protein n=1 Tax=Meristemomyces frigidus TaxID=1508187 RepID=A0AAN7YP83_9PEZI|nr:hypothetical protein LTR62_004425 [Meristemomyces frigidus]
MQNSPSSAMPGGALRRDRLDPRYLLEPTEEESEGSDDSDSSEESKEETNEDSDTTPKASSPEQNDARVHAHIQSVLKNIQQREHNNYQTKDATRKTDVLAPEREKVEQSLPQLEQLPKTGGRDLRIETLRTVLRNNVETNADGQEDVRDEEITVHVDRSKGPHYGKIRFALARKDRREDEVSAGVKNAAVARDGDQVEAGTAGSAEIDHC